MTGKVKSTLASLLGAGALFQGGCGAIVGGYLVAESNRNAALIQAQAIRDAAVISSGQKPQWQCPWNGTPESQINVTWATRPSESPGTLSFYPEGLYFLGQDRAYATIPYENIDNVTIRRTLFTDYMDINTNVQGTRFRFWVNGINLNQLEASIEERVAIRKQITTK